MGKNRKARRKQAPKETIRERTEVVRPEPERPDLDWKLPGWLPFSLLSLALVIRVLYLIENRSNPFFFEPILDAANYDRWAQAIAAGRGGPEGIFMTNPFYPYLLSIIYNLFSRDLILVRMIQGLVGVATCTFVYLTSSRLFGRTAGLLSLLMCSLYGPFIFYEGELLGESWTVAFISATFYFLSRSIPKEKYSIYFLGASGLLLGLAVLSRPNILLFAPLALAWVAWRFWDAGKKASLKGVLCMGLGLFAAIAPVTIRNYMKGGEFVLLTAHGGIAFFIGNNEDADGWFKIPAGSQMEAAHETIIESAFRIAEQNLGKKLTPSEVSDYWLNRGFDFIRKDPAGYMALLGKKFFYSWNAYERPLEANYYFGKQYSRVLRWSTVGFWILGPLSLLGLVLAFPQRREIGWLYLFVASGLLSIVLFFVSSRYRLPLIPGLFPFAAFGGVVLLRQLLMRRWKRVVSFVALLLVFSGFVNWPISGKEKAMAHFYYVLGNNASNRKDYAQAIQYFEQSVQMAENALCLNNLGIAYKETEQYEQAAEAYRKAIIINSKLWRPFYNLGIVYWKMGRFEEAEKTFLQATELNPGCEIAYCSLGNLYSSIGLQDKAITSYKKAIEVTPSFLESYYNLSLEYRKMGTFKEEARILEKLVSRASGKVEPTVYKRLWEYYKNVDPNPEKAELYSTYYKKGEIN